MCAPKKLPGVIHPVRGRVDQRIVVHRIGLALHHQRRLFQALDHRPQSLRRAADRIGALDRLGRGHHVVQFVRLRVRPAPRCAGFRPEAVPAANRTAGVQHLRHAELPGMMLGQVDRRMEIIRRRPQRLHRHRQRAQRQAGTGRRPPPPPEPPRRSSPWCRSAAPGLPWPPASAE